MKTESTKHTPGPWIHDDFDRHYVVAGHIYIAIADDGRDDDEGTAEGRYGTEEEVEANARLIAAAPELLKALRATYAYGNGEATDLDWISTAELAEAAIAKAEGGAQ